MVVGGKGDWKYVRKANGWAELRYLCCFGLVQPACLSIFLFLSLSLSLSLCLSLSLYLSVSVCVDVSRELEILSGLRHESWLQLPGKMSSLRCLRCLA